MHVDVFCYLTCNFCKKRVSLLMRLFAAVSREILTLKNTRGKTKYENCLKSPLSGAGRCDSGALCCPDLSGGGYESGLWSGTISFFRSFDRIAGVHSGSYSGSCFGLLPVKFGKPVGHSGLGVWPPLVPKLRESCG